MRSQVARRILENTPEETKVFVKLYTDIVVRINQVLKEKGYNQKILAEKLNKRPSEINKWLNADHNMTLKSIAKIHSILGEDIIYVHTKPSLSFANETPLFKKSDYKEKKEYTTWKTIKHNEEKRYQLAS